MSGHSTRGPIVKRTTLQWRERDAAILEHLEQAADERCMSANELTIRLIADGLDRLIPADELRMTR